ncbi:MAG: LacI family DNA-binding transcriptional regulator [Sedimentisphaerales bacterium]|nr:LacI family DNA-binding transcriptional regulator [Sedimentisphaerales bacterium]
MSVTLKEIAYSAGVDVSVVSRILNGKASQYRISPACQERVKKIAESLGYLPNAYATGIKKGKFRCVALLQSGTAGSYQGSTHQTGTNYLPEIMVNEIHRNLEKDDTHLLLSNIPEQTVDSHQLPKIFRSLMADGLIINYYQDLPENIKVAIEHTSMPTVWMNYKMDYNAVYSDSFSAAEKATQHLIELGHRRIAYCNVYFKDLQPDAHHSVADRRNGYIEAMNKAGLAVQDITPDHKIDDSVEKQIDLFYSVLKRPDRPTAMLFYWSYSVPSVYAAAARLDLRIPKDLSIITFAGESHLRIGLTATAMLEPETDMGREAVSMLRKKMTLKQKNIPSKRVEYIFAPMYTCQKAPNP